MKRKIKNTLSPLQQKKLIRITLLLLLLAILWVFFAPNMGIVSLHKERKRLQAFEQQKNKLEQENAHLRREMEQIRNDIEYFERVAREKHGLLKKNEIIFDFSKKEKKED